MNKRSGFTLVELLITLVVAAVLLAWGVPSFNRFLERTTLTSETNTWVGVINHARNEAITRGERVTVCRSQNPDACQGDANCNCGVTEAPGSPPNYHTGFLIFTSTGNPQAINFRPGLGNDLIRAGRTQTDQVTIRGNQDADNAFSFMPDGRLDPNDVTTVGGTVRTARHVICTTSDSGDLTAAQNSESSPARVVVISQTGRPRVDQLGPTTCSGTAANALTE